MTSASPLASATSVACAAAALAAWLLLPRPIELAPPKRPVAWSLAAGIGALAVLPGSWALPLLVSVLAAAGGVLLWWRRDLARRAEHTSSLMAEVCDVLAAELVSGRPPDIALAEAAEAWPAFRLVADASRLGGDVPAALREVGATPGASGLRLLAGAWAVSQRTGGGLAAATRRVAESVGREQATRRVVAGELASARATARLMAGLPLMALLMGSGAGADPWTILLATPLGLGCLAGGTVLELAGLWWIELIAREVDP